jgi:hypothetical protein
MAKLKDAPVEELAELISSQLSLAVKNGSGPWWSRAVSQWGPVVVIVFILLGIVTGMIPSKFDKMDHIDSLLQTHVAQEIERQRTSEAEQKLLRVICRNTAKTDIARDSCDR